MYRNSTSPEMLFLLFLCSLCNDFKHLARCYDKWLLRKMVQIACHQIGIIPFSLLHDDFVEYAILWIRHDYVHFFCVYT